MKNKKIINTSKAPKAIGPYSQGVIYEHLIFTSGQIPINIKTNDIISDDFNEQARQVLKNLKGAIGIGLLLEKKNGSLWILT